MRCCTLSSCSPTSILQPPDPCNDASIGLIIQGTQASWFDQSKLIKLQRL